MLSEFDKEGSFDRLFPNQDFHKSLGLGNLIALPFSGQYMEIENTCFLDAKTLEVIPNQWSFIQDIKKNPIKMLDKVFKQFFSKAESNTTEPKSSSSSKLKIVIKNQIYLKRSQLPNKVKLFLREHLNFINSDYIIKKKMGILAHSYENV